MGLFIEIKKLGRAYTFIWLRTMALVIGPIFVLGGVAGMFGFGTIKALGTVLTGISRIIVCSLCIVIGLLLFRLWFTRPQEKQINNKSTS